MVDVKKVLEESHKYNATLTAFLSAVLIKSIIDEMPVRSKGKKPITILIPVNLRNFFPSVSARNFFCLTYIQYDIKKHGEDFETMVDVINTQLKLSLIHISFMPFKPALRQAASARYGLAVGSGERSSILASPGFFDDGTLTSKLLLLSDQEI